MRTMHEIERVNDWLREARGCLSHKKDRGTKQAARRSAMPAISLEAGWGGGGARGGARGAGGVRHGEEVSEGAGDTVVRVLWRRRMWRGGEGGELRAKEDMDR